MANYGTYIRLWSWVNCNHEIFFCFQVAINWDLLPVETPAKSPGYAPGLCTVFWCAIAFTTA